jgi:hypothetical protein
MAPDFMRDSNEISNRCGGRILQTVSWKFDAIG